MFDWVRRALRRRRRQQLRKTLPQGVTIRSVQVNETLAFQCSGCNLVLRRANSRDGFIIEVKRPEGLCTFHADAETTSCRHCHSATSVPRVYTDEDAALEIASELIPGADYLPGTFLRIEPRSR